MQYLNLGADFSRQDLYYLRTLARSLDVDLDALISAGKSSYTVTRSKLLADKQTLFNYAIEVYNASIASAQNIVSSDNAMAAIKDEIDMISAKIGPKITTVNSWEPVQESGSVVINPFKAGVPFTSPAPAAQGIATAPTATILGKLNFPITITPYAVTKGATVVTRSDAGYLQTVTEVQAKTMSSASSMAKKPLGMIAIVAAAVAAYFMFKG